MMVDCKTGTRYNDLHYSTIPLKTKKQRALFSLHRLVGIYISLFGYYCEGVMQVVLIPCWFTVMCSARIARVSYKCKILNSNF